MDLCETEEPCERALSLSGGGYRAMLFHLGALWRLNEAGLLARLDRVSSVSGGSIAAGVLACHWDDLNFDDRGVARNFQATVVADIHRVAGHTIDIGAVLGGILAPGGIGNRVAASYRRLLFGLRTLQDLPDRPRFIFNATSLQTGALWRFQKPYMADYQVGMSRRPQVTLATAVAASSAFPPFLSPVVLSLDPNAFDIKGRGPRHEPPFTHQAVLTDGGVYDNLGLEVVMDDRCDNLLVSDGGGHLSPKGRPWHNWPMQLYRVFMVIDNQVRALRKRQLLAVFKAPGLPNGTYWGIRTEIAGYELADALPCPPERTKALAETATRLKRLPRTHQRRLVNWGYAISDAALRRYVMPQLEAPRDFPYPDEAV